MWDNLNGWKSYVMFLDLKKVSKYGFPYWYDYFLFKFVSTIVFKQFITLESKKIMKTNTNKEFCLQIACKNQKNI